MVRCKWLGHHLPHLPTRTYQQSKEPSNLQALRTLKCPHSCGSSSLRSGCIHTHKHYILCTPAGMPCDHAQDHCPTHLAHDEVEAVKPLTL